MKVVYGSVFQTEVADTVDPAAIFNSLKDTYSELKNGTYEVTGTGASRTMTISVKSGKKA